jgi:hypothetical protein
VFGKFKWVKRERLVPFMVAAFVAVLDSSFDLYRAYRENMHLRLTNYPANFELQCSMSECCNVSG